MIQNIINQSQTTNISQKELEKIISQVLKENQKATEDYKNGKENALMFLIGQVMRKIPKTDIKIIKEKIISQISK